MRTSHLLLMLLLVSCDYRSAPSLDGPNPPRGDSRGPRADAPRDIARSDSIPCETCCQKADDCVWGEIDHEILTRQDVQNLLDNLKQTHPTVVNELISGQLNVGQVQRVLQNLLAEGVSIRNLAGILEKVSDYTSVTKNPDELGEYARRALGAQIARNFQGENGVLKAITLDPKLEQEIARGVRQTQTEIGLVLDPRLARHVMDTLSKVVQQMIAAGHPPVVLCAPQIRLAFRRFFESTFSDLAVLSYAELPARVEIQNAAMIPCLEA